MSSAIAIDSVNALTFSKEKPTEKKGVVWMGRNVCQIVLATAIAGLFILTLNALYEVIKSASEVFHDMIWIPDINSLEMEIKKKFKAAFLDTIKKIPGVDYIRVCKHLALCSKDEEEILSQLQENFHLSDVQMKEILSGAHIRLNDGGKTYDSWVQRMETKLPRISSHPSSSPQYGIRGPFVKELLFSKIEEDNKTYTWFQLENHPVKFGHYIRHLWDYVIYKLTQKNQGPYGSSPANHSKPIILEARLSSM